MQALDPITVTSGLNTPIPIGPGIDRVLIANESPYSIKVSLTGAVRWLPAWTMDLFALSGMAMVGGQISFMPETISSASNAPSTTVLVTLLSAQDQLSGVYPVALARQTNIGNGVIPTSSTTSLINDGSVAGTTIVETTPAGQATSAFSLDNSGNLTLRTLVASVWSVVMQTVSNGSNVFHGTADNVPASGITAGQAPNTVEIGSSTTEKVSFHDLGGGNQVGVISATKATWLASGVNCGLMYNAYYDGTNYRFLATGDNAAQLLLSKDGLGGTIPRWNIRYSTATGVAGNTITWGAWQVLPQMLNNNLVGGAHIYTGTTTPSGAVTGDIWFNA